MAGDPHDPERGGPAPFAGDYAGTDEVPHVNWTMLWRDRLAHRVHTSDRYQTWVLATALTGMFAVGFTITVLAVSIVDIADSLGASETSLTWVVSGPLLTVALTMPLFGKLGDVRGHRRLYLLGFASFAVFTALCALAWDAPSLVLLRVIAAIGGAATGPASMALIMQVFPVEDRVKAMGWWSLVGAGAPVIGVVAGAPLVDAFGWRAIFVAQVPLSLAALVLATVVLRETPRRPHEPIDVAGATLLAVGTVSALLALDRGSAFGWTHPFVLASAVVAPVAFVAFVRAERRAVHPLLPLGFFAQRNFSASLVAQFGSNFAYMGGFIVTPFLTREVFDYSLRATGYVMLCRPLTFSLFAPVAGYLTVKVGERKAAVAGTLLVVASMGIFAVAAHTEQIALVILGLVLSGFGLGASSPALVSSVANSVGESDQGVANAAQATCTQIGVVAGIQLMSALQDGGTGTGPFVAAYLAGGVAAVVGVGGAALVRPAPRPRRLRVVEAA